MNGSELALAVELTDGGRTPEDAYLELTRGDIT
jgi:hypothetical protein